MPVGWEEAVVHVDNGGGVWPAARVMFLKRSSLRSCSMSMNPATSICRLSLKALCRSTVESFREVSFSTSWRRVGAGSGEKEEFLFLCSWCGTRAVGGAWMPGGRCGGSGRGAAAM